MTEHPKLMKRDHIFFMFWRHQNPRLSWHLAKVGSQNLKDFLDALCDARKVS